MLQDVPFQNLVADFKKRIPDANRCRRLVWPFLCDVCIVLQKDPLSSEKYSKYLSYLRIAWREGHSKDVAIRWQLLCLR